MSQETFKYHPNPWFNKEDHLEKFTKPDFLKAMIFYSNNLLTKLERDLHEERTVSNPDYSVYTGSCGVYYMYWYRNKLTQKPIPKERIKNLVDLCKTGLKERRFTFLCGDAGPLALAIVTQSPLVDKGFKMTCFKKLLNLRKLVLNGDADTPNEVLYGRAGYLWTLLFLRDNQDAHELRIEDAFLSQMVESIIQAGRGRYKDRLYFEWHDKEYIGAAHGYIGILYVLLKAKDYWAPGHKQLILKTLTWLVTDQRYPSGNFKSSAGSQEDKLIHWCHGAPGAIFLFLEAATVFDSPEFLNVALECGEIVWERGILRKGYSVCHGIAGNACSLRALYTHTQDERWLKRSYGFAEKCFHYGSSCERTPDRPNSLFEGLAGVVYMLIDFSESQHAAGPSKFPAFQL